MTKNKPVNFEHFVFPPKVHYFSGQSLSVVPGNVITVRCSALPNVHLATFDQSTFTQGAKVKDEKTQK